MSVITHEIGHIFGFTSSLHRAGVAGVSEQCASTLVPGAPVSGLVCQHIIEVVYAAYGFRGVPPADFWSKRIVTGIQVTGSNITLQEGQKDTIQVGGIIFGNQPGDDLQPLGGVSLTFAAQKQNQVILVDASEITGFRAGTDTVRIHIVGGLDPAWQLGSIAATYGREVSVTVTPPPPPPAGPFRVTDITGAPQPITSAGSYYLHATIANPPSGTATIQWRIEYSIGPDGDPLTRQTGWYPNSYRLDVHPGSYNIRVTATPRDGDGSPTGSAYIENFPVCTGGGGGGGGGDGGPYLTGPVPDDGTDAKQGCG